MSNDNELFREFLLTERRLLHEGFWKNEEVGEKRVTYFITLVTTVCTAIGLVASVIRNDGAADEMLLAHIPWVLGFLLMVGVLTWLRMIRRNEVSDEHKRAIDKVYELLRTCDGRLKEYQPWVKGKRRLGRGGLVEIMCGVNAVLVAATATFAIYGYFRPFIVSVLSLIAFLVALAGFYGLTWTIRERARQHRD